MVQEACINDCKPIKTNITIIMGSNQRFSYLLNLYVEGTISYAEHDEFFNMVSTGDYDDILESVLGKTLTAADVYPDVNLPGHIAHNLVRNILDTDKSNAMPAKKSHILGLAAKWLAAASLLLVTVISFYSIITKNNSNRFVSDFLKNSTQNSTNNTDRPLAVLLPDGSRIVLQPKSSLYYSSSKFAGKREVYMEGEAFFEVAKNPLKPFYVYYNKVITKVLGTSFSIRTNHRTGNIEVAVLTGKVQVFENEKIVNNKQENMSVIVTPNQKAVYETKKLFFETVLVDKPVPIPVIDDEKTLVETKVKPVIFDFDNISLSEVLQKLADAYGIEIIVSNEDIYNCVFSGDVTKEDLFNKLKIICLATGSEYEVNGTKILIKGNGCKKN